MDAPTSAMLKFEENASSIVALKEASVCMARPTYPTTRTKTETMRTVVKTLE